MQVPGSNNFKVGGNPVEFGKDRFKQLMDDASLIPIPEANKEQFDAISERVNKDGVLSDADMKTLEGFNKAAFSGKGSYKSGLYDQLKTAPKENKGEVRKKLADVNVYADGFYSLKDSIKAANAKAAVAALAGASFGPTGVLVAYQTYADLKADELKPVVDTIADLRSGHSSIVYQGNQVEQVHQEKLWPAMNHLQAKGIEAGKAGQPTQVFGQYYELTSPEIVGGFAENAKAGNPTFVNVDAGRITPPPKEKIVEIDDAPDKLRSVLQMLDAGVAVTTYPVAALLGEPSNLMHRKLMGVGDEVLLSGMNSNAGSGENIDRGYIMQGPAAKRKSEDFKRDCLQSLEHKTAADRFGKEELENFKSNTVRMGARGLSAMMDALKGPEAAGKGVPHFKSYDELNQYAKERGFDLGSLLAVPADQAPAAINAMLAGGPKVELSETGKQTFLDLVDKVMERTNDPANVQKFEQLKEVSGEAKGTTEVTLADVPAERQATALETIQHAEKYILAPTFVITRPIAAAIAARKNEMEAQGQKLDVRMVADSGVYPDGGTPNETGVFLLEDQGISVRWTMLTRSGWHDRKIHAKDILTEKEEWFGSTNLSNKGMRENWEHSGVVKFDDKDPKSVEMREHAKGLFEEMWEHESLNCNLTKLATRLVTEKFHYEGRDLKSEVSYQRGKKLKELIGMIETYEKETGDWVSKKAEAPAVQARIKEYMAAGMDDGNATLLAVRESMPKDEFYNTLAQLPSRKELNSFAYLGRE